MRLLIEFIAAVFISRFRASFSSVFGAEVCCSSGSRLLLIVVMAAPCPSCLKPVTDENVYVCAGWCNESFHHACMGVSDAVLNEILIPESLTSWSCAGCKNIRRCKSVLLDEFTAVLDGFKEELLKEFDRRFNHALVAMRNEMLKISNIKLIIKVLFNTNLRKVKVLNGFKHFFCTYLQ